MVVAPPLALAAFNAGLIAAAGDRGEVSLDRAQSVGLAPASIPNNPTSANGAAG